MNFSVLGSGRWGSFITWYLAYKKFSVTEWGRPESSAFLKLIETRKNEYVEIPKEVQLTSDLCEAVNFCDVAIIAIKSQALRELAKKAKQF